MILRMPFVNRFKGIEVTRKLVWVADLWVQRMLNSRPELSQHVSSIVPLGVPHSKLSGPPVVEQIIVKDGGWYPVTTYWNSKVLTDQLGVNNPYWLETDPTVEDHVEVLNSVVVPCQSDGILKMDVWLGLNKMTLLSRVALRYAV